MKVVNFGSLNIDHVYAVDHFCRAGETIHTKSYTQNAGGKGLNQSIAVARSGQKLYHAGLLGAEGAQLVRSRAADILAAPASEREARTRRLDMELIERNLSPGGSADLLAMAFFLEKALPLLGQEEA